MAHRLMIIRTCHQILLHVKQKMCLVFSLEQSPIVPFDSQVEPTNEQMDMGLVTNLIPVANPSSDTGPNRLNAESPRVLLGSDEGV